MSKMIKVLSIDGGGMRGIIPARVLAEIEQRTNKSIASMFDLIAGTSTGGILALGLTKPGKDGKPQYSAKDGVAFYEQEGSTIFSRSLWHTVTALGNLADEKYPATGIEHVLQKYFGDTRLKEAVTNIFITSYEIEKRTAFFFRSSRAKLMPDYDYPMRDVARATSAAPTYFEPAKIKCIEPPGYYALVDGGVFANNPAMCAYVEAKTLFPDADQMVVVSLGTGELTRPIPWVDARNWGLARWAQPILSVVFDGITDTIDYQLRQLVLDQAGSERYFRFQTELNVGNDSMDDATNTNLLALNFVAGRLIGDNNDKLDNLCKLLTQ